MRRRPGSLPARELARVETLLLAGRYSAAAAAGRRALAAGRSNGDAATETLACAWLVLVARPAEFPVALAEYRRLVQRRPDPVHTARLKLLERFAAAGGRAPRERRLIERSRRGSTPLPLWRLWTPRREAVRADLYWDQVQHRLHLSGRGPFLLGDHPVLESFLCAVLARPGFAIPLPELFTAVWQVPWSPLLHQPKCHVTLHRLRAWLAGRAGHDRPLLVLRDGVVAIADDLDVRVLQAEGTALRAPAPDLGERILDALGDGVRVAAGDLERRVGSSRSALHGALRRLVADGAVAREGAGPAIRYRRT